MFSRFGDIDPGLALMDELRRRMERVWEDVDPTRQDGNHTNRALSASSWPRANLFDTGTSLVLKADVPGLSEKEIQVTLNGGSLSISGERRVTPPEGYGAQRQERASVTFSRSLSLPCKVNPEQTTASVKNGVLTITLAKVPEAQPRRIAVQGQ